MANQIFRVHKNEELKKAGPTDLIELLPVAGNHPLFIMKSDLETLVYGIVANAFIHISGPTGTAKSSLIEALYLEQKNFLHLCSALGFDPMPLKLYPVEMAIFETPGELYQRRSLANGTTYDDKSKIISAMEEAAGNIGTCYPLIWLREMGRVHSSSVQGGLLNLMTKGDVVLSDGTRISGREIGWVADSNYQAETDSVHTLVTLDDALKRRFYINLTLNYLSPDHEVQILQRLCQRMKKTEWRSDDKLIWKVVHLGNVIRRHRSEGNLQSITPPTIWGYLAFLEMAHFLPHLNMFQIAQATLLGNATPDDRKTAVSVFNEVFGLHFDEEETALGGNLF